MNVTNHNAKATHNEMSLPATRTHRPSLFVWKDTFRLGIAAVDRDHQHFFELINGVQDAMMCGMDETAVRATIDMLADYARDHFAREEQELAAIGYPHLSQHEAEHRYFLGQLDRMASEPKASARRILALAHEWLIEHILKTDKQYAVWLRNS
jgi:hemerythrin